MSGLTAKEVIALLELERHPEGGWYRQTFADPNPDGERHRDPVHPQRRHCHGERHL